MKAEQLMSTCSQQQISQIDYLTCCNLTSRVSTRSFLGLSFKSGTLRRMEQRPPRPSYEQTPAHLKTYTLSHPCWLFQVRVAKGNQNKLLLNLQWQEQACATWYYIALISGPPMKHTLLVVNNILWNRYCTHVHSNKSNLKAVCTYSYTFWSCHLKFCLFDCCIWEILPSFIETKLLPPPTPSLPSIHQHTQSIPSKKMPILGLCFLRFTAHADSHGLSLSLFQPCFSCLSKFYILIIVAKCNFSTN